MKKVLKIALLAGACVVFFLFFRNTEQGKKLLEHSEE